jgi:hypothetical protein
MTTFDPAVVVWTPGDDLFVSVYDNPHPDSDRPAWFHLVNGNNIERIQFALTLAEMSSLIDALHLAYNTMLATRQNADETRTERTWQVCGRTGVTWDGCDQSLYLAGTDTGVCLNETCKRFGEPRSLNTPTD